MYVADLIKRGSQITGTTLSAYFKKPHQVATVCPSSAAVTGKIANRECVRKASVVVDLGAGTGSTTKALLRCMSSNAKLLAIELTSDFIPSLLEIRDPRLIVEHADALQLGRLLAKHRLRSADVIVSGLPFSVFDEKTARKMMRAISSSLKASGHLVAYQFRDHVTFFAEEVFPATATVSRVWLNIPPLRIYDYCKAEQ